VQTISKFEISNLFGTKNISLSISDNAIILVGPNGIGKSSVANMFYFFISRQWSRLLDYSFSELSIQIDNQTIVARREDITGVDEVNKQLGGIPPDTRPGRHLAKLVDLGELQTFLAADQMSVAARRRYAQLLETSGEDVLSLQRFLQRRLDGGDLFRKSVRELETTLSKVLASRILYLPTYRRIEKELKDIFPDIEERYRSFTRTDVTFRSGRSAAHYVELVSFGMEDVKTRLNEKMQQLRDYSLSQHNNLSALYLRDVIHGRADKYESAEINALTDENITAILDRVSEAALSKEDKDLLRKKVKSIQGKTKTNIETNERFLAHYFSRLVSVNVDITKRERDVKSFVDVCNQYLSPAKRMVYDEAIFSVAIHDEHGTQLDLSVLSSGEKQVIAIFAHLYLDDANDQIVVIDEPELSLSVPWQKRFLTDIQDSGKCGFILAVTHSPFIYENRLRSRSTDLRRMIAKQ